MQAKKIKKHQSKGLLLFATTPCENYHFRNISRYAFPRTGTETKEELHQLRFKSDNKPNNKKLLKYTSDNFNQNKLLESFIQKTSLDYCFYHLNYK